MIVYANSAQIVGQEHRATGNLEPMEDSCAGLLTFWVATGMSGPLRREQMLEFKSYAGSVPPTYESAHNLSAESRTFRVCSSSSPGRTVRTRKHGGYRTAREDPQ